MIVMIDNNNDKNNNNNDNINDNSNNSGLYFWKTAIKYN